MSEKRNLLGCSLESLEGFFINLQEPKFRAKQLLKWIHEVKDLSKNYSEAVERLEKLKIKTKEIELPNLELSLPVYYVIAPAECSANLSRYDGIRFGYRAENVENLEDLYFKSRGEGFGKETKKRILIGTYCLSSGFYDAYYKKAQNIRNLIRHDFHEAFKQVDVIIAPTVPSPAFKIGELRDDPVTMYLQDVFTIPVNLAELPSIALPCGFVKGLPVGFQIIGPKFNEHKLLNVAHQYQKVTDWHKQVPEQYA